jgi:hypothetical protein
MKGNFHVRFLGEGVAAMPLPYPTWKASRQSTGQEAYDERSSQSQNLSSGESSLGQSQGSRKEKPVRHSIWIGNAVLLLGRTAFFCF